MTTTKAKTTELGAPRPTQAQPAEPEDAFEMGEQHLDALSVTAGLLECFGLGQCPGDVTRRLIHAARTLRIGAFGQHCGLSGQPRQSRALGR
jgi:hypothetical protein